MLRSEPESDHLSGNPAEEGKPRQQPDWEWRRKSVPIGQCSPDDAVLNRELHSLRHPGRPFTPGLDLGQVLIGDLAAAQWRRQDIGRRNRILDSQVDPDTTDR